MKKLWGTVGVLTGFMLIFVAWAVLPPMMEQTVQAVLIFMFGVWVFDWGLGEFMRE